MPNYLRADITGATYFFTVVTCERQPVLTNEAARRALHDAVVLVRQRYPFAIDAWVLFPDHLHCIWTLPRGDADFSTRWSIIKRLVSTQLVGCAVRTVNLSQRLRRELPFWQRRFWEHQIRDERDFMRYVDYLHWNPVKHGYSGTAAAWPYSTFHRYVREGIYPVDWGGNDGSDGEDFGE